MDIVSRLRKGLALLSQAHEPHLVRRCLAHHVALDEDLHCPTGLHPTKEERDLQNGAGYLTVTFRWEVFNEETGEVVNRVLGDFRIEWPEEQEPAVHLSGRNGSGLAHGSGYRRKVGRWRKGTTTTQRRHRVEPARGRPGRKSEAA